MPFVLISTAAKNIRLFNKSRGKTKRRDDLDENITVGSSSGQVGASELAFTNLLLISYILWLRSSLPSNIKA